MTQLIIANSSVGTHAGNITKPAHGAISTKYLLGTLGEPVSGESSIAICGSTDLPLGVITDEAASQGEFVNVALLGGSDTLLAVANSVVTEGSILIPADGGKVSPLPGAGASDAIHVVIGVALTAAAANQIVEFASCVPHQHVVPAQS